MSMPLTRPALSRLVPADRVGWVVAVSLGVAYTAAGWARHQNYWSGGFDLGIFDQAVWLLSEGMAPHVTVIGRTIFADHFSPVLVLFTPLYWLAATPFWLILVQGLALGATVVPLRAFAREAGVHPGIPTLAVACSAPLFAGALFDFHPAVLTTPFIALALLGARRGDARMVTWAALAVVLCRGDQAWTLLAMVPLAQGRTTRIRLAIVSIAGLAAASIIPAAFGAHGHWDVHFGHLGDSPFDAVLQPWRAVDALFSEDALITLGLIFLPVGFLPVARPVWAAVIIVAALPVLLSGHHLAHTPWFHYGTPLVPLTVGATVAAFAGPLSAPQHVIPLVAGLGLALFLNSPLAPRAPDAHRLWSVLEPQEDAPYGELLDEIGPDVVVSAGNRALPHLTHREEIWPFPSPFVPVQPAGIGPEPDADAAARVEVVLLSADGADDAREYGFVRARPDTGRLWLGRRP